MNSTIGFLASVISSYYIVANFGFIGALFVGIGALFVGIIASFTH